MISYLIEGLFMTEEPASPTFYRHASRATWIKLGIAILSVAVGLTIFKIALAWPGTFFLTAFGSFMTVLALSVALYYGVLWMLRRRANEQIASAAS